MLIANFRHPELHIDEFATAPGEAWCVFGENHSGIDRLIDLLSGNLVNGGADILLLPNHPGVLSFRAQQSLFEEEIRNDDSDYLNKTDPGTLVRDFLPGYHAHLALLETFAMTPCLDLGYRQLSSGQARKLLLLRELTGGATSLVMENPYDGLDHRSRHELNLAFGQLRARNIELLVTVNTQSDIPAWSTHLAIIKNGRLACAGPKDRILPLLTGPGNAGRTSHQPIAAIFLDSSPPAKGHKEELVVLRNGFAGYGGNTLFTGLDLTVHTGDHTLIVGPNGSGKSTLLDMITGDNPKCYANNLRIFGKRRGTGESIWEIKKHMGIVSPALHRDHRIPGSALQVVVSGLYDSIGLYHKATSTEIRTARQWLAWIDLPGRADVPFRRLSFAEQRQVLIARALIKRPKLLVLDEPTQGLDDGNRNTLLDLLEKIASRNLATILFVSHRRDEHRPFFRRQIRLDPLAL